jgi:hypothetical protein
MRFLRFPHGAREVAVQRWAELHPYLPWPFDPPRGLSRPQFSLQDIAEADVLMQEATVGDPAHELLFPQHESLARNVAYLGTLIGDGTVPYDFWWKADWNSFNVQKGLSAPPSPTPNELAFADWATKLSLPPPLNPYGASALLLGAVDTRNQQTQLYMFATSDGRINWDNVGGMSDLIRRYLGHLTPQEQLANWISIKNIAFKEHWSQKLQDYWTMLVGRAARDNKHLWSDP